MSLSEHRNQWMLAAVSVMLGVVSLVVFAPEQIRLRPADAVLTAFAYFGSVGVLALLYSRLHAATTLARTLPTFQVASAIALLVAVLGLQISFTYLRETEAPVAAALTVGWTAVSLAIAIGAATRGVLHGSFTRGFALTALAVAGLTVAVCSAPWLGIGQ